MYICIGVYMCMYICACVCVNVGTCVYMFYVHVCDWMPDVCVTMFDEKGRSNKVFII